jgi:GT2 family glycosyltransferase
MKIAILITCFNRKATTLNCLKSLNHSIAQTEAINFKIFLVDDDSTDGTAEAIKSEYPKITIIQGNGNLYWNRGMILAWQTASKDFYDHYLWLNDDVILRSGSLDQLIRDSETFNNESIICGVCEANDGTISYSGYLLKNKIRLIPKGYPISCDFFNGNVVLVPHFVFNRVGYLDPYFHHDQGDINYGLRAKKAGINSYISSIVVAECERHSMIPEWCNPTVPLRKRIKAFYSPLGGHPGKTFVNQRMHFGIFYATFHYFTIHLRLFFPSIWLITNKVNI